MNQIEFNVISGSIVKHNRLAVHLNILALEVFVGSGCRSVVEHTFDIRLQVLNKGLVALAGDNCQHIDIMYLFTETLDIHSVAALVDAKAQASAYFLSFGGFFIGVL